MKIFILSPNIEVLFTPELKKQLNDLGEVVWVNKIQPINDISGLMSGTEEKILAIDPDFNDWTVKNEDIEKIPNLKAIILQTTSFSWIDVDFAKSKNIPVVNLRGFSSVAVAEWATMMILNVARKLSIIIKDGWKQDYTKHRGIELRGKLAGVIGMGRIGKTIAENLQGLGMEVQYWSKTSTDSRFKQVSLEELMKTSDVIVPAVAKNDQTKGLITDPMINSMKKLSIFVSIVHEVYNHELLLQKVAKGEIYGYGLEGPNNDISKFEGNVWAGPELAWCTDDSMRKNGEQWTEAITLAFKGTYKNRVN